MGRGEADLEKMSVIEYVGANTVLTEQIKLECSLLH